eukprot:TRINITY_DN37488_c0_g1_i3.p1 TRINITY_DN37488_c0_g1~~TRINITY_DN37488_c0_g1_i3.p1  ORF type:complete len:296 (+),score=69.57 TRINITY_DN37488_c0_g1_i3:96-890(+)
MATGLMVFIHAGRGADPVAVTVGAAATVGDVRQAAKEQGVDLGAATLTFTGEPLDERSTLADLGIGAESTLFCHQRQLRWHPAYVDGPLRKGGDCALRISEEAGKLIAASTDEEADYALLDGGLTALPSGWRSPLFRVRKYSVEMYFGLTRGKIQPGDSYDSERHILNVCVQSAGFSLWTRGSCIGSIALDRESSPYRIRYDEGTGFGFELGDGTILAPADDQQGQLLQALAADSTDATEDDDNDIYLFVGTFCDPPGTWEVTV